MAKEASWTEMSMQPSTSDPGQGALNPPCKQAKLEFGQRTAQSTINKLILDFVIDDVQPFSLAEQPSFKKLVEGKTEMCRKTLVQNIETEFAVMKNSLTETLMNVSNVCTTADLWTALNRRFLGMTCHWIEENTLERRSAALACARIKGLHTFDVLVAKNCEIHAEYKLQHKVRATVTDNGSKFVKAFREFHTSEDIAADDLDDGTLFLDMDAVLEMQGDEEHLFLPPHQMALFGKFTEVQWENVLLYGTRHTSQQ